MIGNSFEYQNLLFEGYFITFNLETGFNKMGRTGKKSGHLPIV